jgi:hypothetical protein
MKERRLLTEMGTRQRTTAQFRWAYCAVTLMKIRRF